MTIGQAIQARKLERLAAYTLEARQRLERQLAICKETPTSENYRMLDARLDLANELMEVTHGARWYLGLNELSF